MEKQGAVKTNLLKSVTNFWEAKQYVLKQNNANSGQLGSCSGSAVHINIKEFQE